MASWHEFERAPGVCGQGSLVCCSPWGCKESDSIETELNWMFTAALFIIDKTGKQPKCPSTEEQAKIWYIYTMECSVQFSQSVMSASVTPWTAARQASLSITNSHSLSKLMFIESVIPSNHLILCHHPLLLPSVFASIRVFSNESALCIRWPKYWSFSFNISPSNEHPGLISFRMDWLEILAVQGALNHSSKASILWRSAFFIVQLECYSAIKNEIRPFAATSPRMSYWVE